MAQWQKVFFVAAAVYIACATFYLVFASGERQPWDNPLNDEPAVPINQIATAPPQQTQDKMLATTNGVIQLNGNGTTNMNGNGVHETTQ